MTFLLLVLAVIIVAGYLRKLRRELAMLRVDVEWLRRRLDVGTLLREEATPRAQPRSSKTPPAAVRMPPREAVPAPAAEPPREAVSPPAAEPPREAVPPFQRVPPRETVPPRRAESLVGAAATLADVAAADAPPAGKAGILDLETRFGTTWTLRVGLGAIAVAAALFARTIVPNLSPTQKVVLAYAGAMALVAVGRAFERRLARFGRPLMAGGLAIGFFVSFAAHFVPAMRTVPLLPALLWMAAGASAILALANRWRSEKTAGLAIVLGHLAAYVAAGDADTYSLVVILFLSVAAVYLLWRHAWLPLSLVAVVAAYASHLLWSLADHTATTPARALLLSTMFLSSYYSVFLAADLLWWRRRRNEHADGASAATLGRMLGPVNLVLYASTATFLYFATGAAGSLTGYLLGVGVLQLALALPYRQLENHDWAFYPALGTIFITLGFVSGLDALSLDVVLATEALVLLVAARRTSLRVFQLLAQVVLAACFAHYLWFSAAQPATFALFLGGITIALAYVTQALLEEHWYGPNAPWRTVDTPPGFTGAVATGFDAAFRTVAPYLAHVHAAGGALILLRASFRFLPNGDALPVLLAAVSIIAVAAVTLRSIPLMIAYAITHFGAAAAAIAASGPAWQTLSVAAALLALPTALLHHTRRHHTAQQLAATAFVTLASVVSGLFALIGASNDIDTVRRYGAWVGVAALAFIHVDRAAAAVPRSALIRVFNTTIGVVTAAAIVAATVELTSSAASINGALWITLWAAVLFAAATWRRDAGFYLAAYALMAVATTMGLVDGAAAAPTAAVLLIAALPLSLALAQDYLGAGRALGTTARLALATSLAYVFATALLWSLFDARLGQAWSISAMAGVALGIYVASQRAAHATGPAFATALMAVVLTFEFSWLQTPIVRESGTHLGVALLVGTAALALERLVVSRNAAAGLIPTKYVAIALVAAAALVALMAFERASWTGAAYATIGFSLVGAALMTLGFIARSAHHRRIALIVFALTLVRAFVVDQRALSDSGRTLAFLVVGLSLLAVAWLYARFASRIREWL